MDGPGRRRCGQAVASGKVGLPVNVQLQAFYNAETPEFGPDWQLRAQVQFLFPRSAMSRCRKPP